MIRWPGMLGKKPQYLRGASWLHSFPTVRPLVIAHRGASGLAPENTSLAVATAIALGADMVEVDAQLSRDDHLIIFHDRTLSRTARFSTRVSRKTPRSTSIGALTLDEIRTLDAGSWRGRAFAGLGVPTLPDILAQCIGRIALNLEIKLRASHASDERHVIVAQLVEALRAYPASAPVLISSSNVMVLELVRAQAPAARLGVLIKSNSGSNASTVATALRIADRLDAFSLHLPCAMVRPPLVNTIHRRGFRLFAYTANGIASMRRLIAVGVDGILTDHPERLITLLRRESNRP